MSECARKAIEAGGDSRNQDQSVGIMLLSDIYNMFVERGVERLTSADLVAGIIAIEGRPWAEWKADKPITTNSLARLLARFQIRPSSIRIESNTPKGYLLAQFADAFSRYLPPTTATPQQP